MISAPDPLVQFGERLYFTTFPHPAPPHHILNDPRSQPRARVRPKGRFHGQIPTPDDQASYYWFTIDDDLVYMSFFEDWGPLNLGMVYKVCILIHELLEDKEIASKRLVLYTSNDPRRKANAALLMALFVMVVQRRQPWEAFHPIAEMEFMPFRDAGRGRSDFNLSIQDCLWGFWKATHYGLCDLNEFSLEDYEYYEKVENGDWNWITPHFIAFASPVDTVWMKKGGPSQQAATCSSQPTQNGSQTHGRSQSHSRIGSQPFSSSMSSSSSSSTSSSLQKKLPTPFLNCLEYFSDNRVKTIVRLNNPLYDKNTFLERGFEHVELYFDDGTNPTDEIVRKFLEISDRNIEAGGVVAVHCKAGLGRTGTLIGAYLIYKYGFTANEAIAFMRIVRPGCVVGPQQQYMYTRQLEWSKWAAVDELRKAEESSKIANGRGVVTPPMDEVMPLAARAPVTPPRQTATSELLVPPTVEPPGQPRKTPATKRIATEMDIDEEDAAEEKEAEDIVTALTSAAPGATANLLQGRTTPTQRGRQGAPKQLRAPPATERTQRTTRSTTRSATTGLGPKRTGPSGGITSSTASSNIAALRSNAKTPTPNQNNAATSTASGSGVRTRSTALAAGGSYKIPRLAPTTSGAANSTTANKTKQLPPSTRRSGRPASPSPAGSGSPHPLSTRSGASRLPTLIPSKRGFGAPHGPVHSYSDTNTLKVRKPSGSSRSGTGPISDALNGDGEGGEAEEANNAWVTESAGSVVNPGSKLERPGLRNVKRRRSSFSAADVIA